MSCWRDGAGEPRRRRTGQEEAGECGRATAEKGEGNGGRPEEGRAAVDAGKRLAKGATARAPPSPQASLLFRMKGENVGHGGKADRILEAAKVLIVQPIAISLVGLEL